MTAVFKGLGILFASIILGLFLGCFSELWASSRADLSKPVVVGVLIEASQKDFEEKYLPLLTEQMKKCAYCSIQNLTPYTEKGEFAVDQASEKIANAVGVVQLLFLNWNEKTSESTKAVADSVKKLVEAGVLVVAAAGLAKENEPTLSLNKTFMGQIPGVVIIGELGERERLLTQSFFGPEMLTALKPPKEYVGLGYGPLFFVSKLALEWNKRPSDEWVQHFQQRKQKIRRIWPDANDLIGQ